MNKYNVSRVPFPSVGFLYYQLMTTVYCLTNCHAAIPVVFSPWLSSVELLIILNLCFPYSVFYSMLFPFSYTIPFVFYL